MLLEKIKAKAATNFVNVLVTQYKLVVSFFVLNNSKLNASNVVEMYMYVGIYIMFINTTNNSAATIPHQKPNIAKSMHVYIPIAIPLSIVVKYMHHFPISVMLKNNNASINTKLIFKLLVITLDLMIFSPADKSNTFFTVFKRSFVVLSFTIKYIPIPQTNPIINSIATVHMSYLFSRTNCLNHFLITKIT